MQIISTSQFELPARLRNECGDRWLIDRAIPPFTDDEACELFRAYGAPDSFLKGRRLGFLNGLAAGHPLLLAATAEFLAGRGWQYREEEIDALLRGDHTNQVMPEVIDRLTRTIGDQPRELLYRLTIPMGSFEQADVIALAGVAPLVERPRERFTELLGVWVQRDTDTLFTVSPLVKGLGKTELAPDVSRDCYRELANAIVLKRVLNQHDADRAILYNLAACEFSRAITLYLLALIASMKEPQGKHLVPVIDKWRETLLPAELSIGQRLCVRAYQLAAFAKFNLNTRFILQDIDLLLGQASEREGWGIVALAVMNMGHLRTEAPDRLLIYVRRVIALPKVYGPDGSEMDLDRIYPPDLLWMLVTDLSTPAILRQWFDVLEDISVDERQRFWNTELARQAIWLIPNKLYTSEWEKPKEAQDWDALIGILDGFRLRARRIGHPLLEAVFTGLMIDIQGDRKRFDELPALAESTLTQWPSDPDVQFEVQGTLGRQYAFQRRPEFALPLLDGALSQPHHQNDYERLRCLLAANYCAGDTNRGYAERARELARSSRDAPAIEAAVALGEYALSSFLLQSGQVAAIAIFPAWSEAMRHFFGVPSKDKIWRNLFPLFAHVTGFLAQFAREGSPPDRTIEGEKWVAPSRGFFLKEYMPEREAFYRPGIEAGVYWLMHQYAAASSSNEESTYWMKLAVEESRLAGAAFIQVLTSRDAVPDLLLSGCFEDAIEASVFAGRGMLVGNAIESRTRENFDGVGIDLTAEFRW